VERGRRLLAGENPKGKANLRLLAKKKEMLVSAVAGERGLSPVKGAREGRWSSGKGR